MAKSNRRKPKRKAGDNLTKQQRKFVEHYVLNGNGAEAYFHAYPSSRKHTPQYRAEHARDLMALGHIKSQIDARRTVAAKTIEDDFAVTVKRVLEEYASIALANSDDYFEWGVREVPQFTKNGDPIIGEDGKQVTEPQPYAYAKPSASLTRRQKAAIVGASMTFSKTGDPTVEVKMANKLAALKDLGTFLKMFNQQIDHTVALSGPNGGPVEVSTPDLKGLSPVDALKAFELLRGQIRGG